MEQWKNVSYLPPSVQVSNQGKVRIFDTMKSFHEVELKNYNNYMCFNFNGATIQVHRAVADAFVPNPQGLNVVKHRDGDAYNNNADNLYWGSNASNFSKSTRHRTRIYCIENNTVYGSIRSAAHATGIQQELIVESMKSERAPVCGFTFKRIEQDDHSFDDYEEKYAEFNDLMSLAKQCNSAEEYNSKVRKLIESKKL